MGEGLELRGIVAPAEVKRHARGGQALLRMAEAIGADAGVAEEPDRLQPVAVLDRRRGRDQDLLTPVYLALPDGDMSEEGFDVRNGIAERAGRFRDRCQPLGMALRHAATLGD